MKPPRLVGALCALLVSVLLPVFAGCASVAESRWPAKVIRKSHEAADHTRGFGFTSMGLPTFEDTDDDGLPDARTASGNKGTVAPLDDPKNLLLLSQLSREDPKAEGSSATQTLH